MFIFIWTWFSISFPNSMRMCVYLDSRPRPSTKDNSRLHFVTSMSKFLSCSFSMAMYTSSSHSLTVLTTRCVNIKSENNFILTGINFSSEKLKTACNIFLNIFLELGVGWLILYKSLLLPRLYVERLHKVERWLEGTRYEGCLSTNRLFLSWFYIFSFFSRLRLRSMECFSSSMSKYTRNGASHNALFNQLHMFMMYWGPMDVRVCMAAWR